MKVKELTRYELIELKCNYYTGLLNEKGETPSWGEYAEIDTLVSDEEIFEFYSGIEFTREDFFCEDEEWEPA